MPLPIRGSKLCRKPINGMAAFMEGGCIRGAPRTAFRIGINIHIDIFALAICTALMVSLCNLDLVFILIPSGLKVRALASVHTVTNLIIMVFAKLFSKLGVVVTKRFDNTGPGCNGQASLGTAVHEGLNPISIFHVGGNIVHIPISVPGGSFTSILGINGRGRSSSTVGMERRHGHTGFILGNGDHLTIKPTTNGTGMGIQRFNDFHHFNIQILVTFLGGNGVEIGGFSINQPPRLMPMNPELLLNDRGDLGRGITPKKPLRQALANRTHQIILVQPTAIPEGSPVRCPRL